VEGVQTHHIMMTLDKEYKDDVFESGDGVIGELKELKGELVSPVQKVENLRVNLKVVEMEHSHTGLKRMSDDYGRCTTLLRSIDDGRVL
jgi:hypothetical protein